MVGYIHEPLYLQDKKVLSHLIVNKFVTLSPMWVYCKKFKNVLYFIFKDGDKNYDHDLKSLNFQHQSKNHFKFFRVVNMSYKFKTLNNYFLLRNMLLM